MTSIASNRPGPVISIVGRPNVGKSTLFNRLLGFRKAITEDTPGVTRDRNYGEFEYRGTTFVLVDTGGFEPSRESTMAGLIKGQVEASVRESSVILFVLDGKEGLLPPDLEIADILRKQHKPVLCVVNKMDSPKRELGMAEFYMLGTGELYAVSSLHGLGVGDLLDRLWDLAKTGAPEGMEGERPAPEEEEVPTIRVAIVGRPNTGKSSIVNRILGSDRMIVSDLPGTTRDSIDSTVLFRDRRIVLIDTAGLRRKSRIDRKVEGYSVASALKTVERAHVVNLIIDGSEGVSHQDGAIGHMVVDRGCGLCVVINKSDLLPAETTEARFREFVYQRIPHASFCPVLFTSALTGKNVAKILETDLRIFGNLHKRIATPALNRAFREFTSRLAPSHAKGKQVKILYANQVNAGSPTFLLFANHPEAIPEHYKRYLENCLREKFGFAGAPIRLIFKARQ